MLAIVRFPLAAPDAVGVKVTLRVTLWPVFNVAGKVLPADANGPETLTPLTVIDPELLFETKMV